MPIWTEEGKGRSGALKGGGEKGKRVEEIGINAYSFTPK
jgi:hypothetical protein